MEKSQKLSPLQKYSSRVNLKGLWKVLEAEGRDNEAHFLTECVAATLGGLEVCLEGGGERLLSLSLQIGEREGGEGRGGRGEGGRGEGGGREGEGGRGREEGRNKYR